MVSRTSLNLQKELTEYLSFYIDLVAWVGKLSTFYEFWIHNLTVQFVLTSKENVILVRAH